MLKKLTLITIVSLGLISSGCKKSPGDQNQPQVEPPAPVLVGQVEKKTVPVEIRTFGTVESNISVQVTSKIGGELMQVNFQEGQDVKQGDPLFTIDPRPYQAALAQAQALLARDQAQLQNAQQEFTRAQSLLKEGVMNQEQYDQRQAALKAAQAAIEADNAAIQTAQLNLQYCSITSPITGRTGDLKVDLGNQVKANGDPMVTINQFQPIDVRFSIPQQYLPVVKAALAQGKKLEVRAQPRGAAAPVQGTLSFVDNIVNQQTGTIDLKGSFPNAETLLWPGLYVDVTFILAQQEGAIVVPTPAVQTGQQGEYVWVLAGDMTVKNVPVKVDRALNGDTVIQPAPGATPLEPGAQVITDGQLRLAPGKKVEIKQSLEQAAAEAVQGRSQKTEDRSQNK